MTCFLAPGRFGVCLDTPLEGGPYLVEFRIEAPPPIDHVTRAVYQSELAHRSEVAERLLWMTVARKAPGLLEEAVQRRWVSAWGSRWTANKRW